jgi:hypothetical protein
MRSTSHKMPTSTSLSHIRSLTAQMQRLEARVHNARSRLPAPISTPPRASPRSSVMGGSSVPSTVTIRSRKRAGGSEASSGGGDDTTPTNTRQGDGVDLRSSVSSISSISGGKSHIPRLSTSGVSRLSFGPLPNRNPGYDPEGSRPSSRASISSLRPPSRSEHFDRSMPPPRPVSRASLSGARTPLGRPRSSLSGHRESFGYGGVDMDDDGDAIVRTPSRTGMYSRYEADAATAPSAIPMPSSARRQSAGGASINASSGRRMSSGPGAKLRDVGETF